MKEKTFNIAKKISELNEGGVCTRGWGTFGCACPACFDLIRERIKELLGTTNQ